MEPDKVLHASLLGDLYGGAHYSQSASATLTPQGRAIRDASIRFGDGATLPFTPCKKGYAPVVGINDQPQQPMFACPLHHEYRRKRYIKEGKIFRKGEVDLSVFWTATPQAAGKGVSDGQLPVEE